MRFLLALLLFVRVSFGAAGDTTVSINADGWSGALWIDSGATNQSYTTGLGANNSITGSERAVITLSAPGYDSTGATQAVAVTIYGTKGVRFPYSATGDEDFLDTTLGGTTVRTRFSLSEFVASTDIVTANLTANFYNGQNAVSSLAVTNNSGENYLPPFGQWDGVAGVRTYDRVKNDFTVAFNARATYGVACVKFDATGRTSGHTQSATVSTRTATLRTGSGLYHEAFQSSIAIAGFTQGELIDLRARVYPVRGVAIFDTDNYTTNFTECLGFNKATILCDKSNLLDDIVYVSTTGNDTTGDGSSGNPYLTIGKGYENGNVVYLKAGDHAAVGKSLGARVTGNEWRIVMPEPGQDSSTVSILIDSTFRSYNCERLQYQGVKVKLVNNTSWLAGNFSPDRDALRFKSCVFDRNGVGAAASAGLSRNGTLGQTGMRTNLTAARSLKLPVPHNQSALGIALLLAVAQRQQGKAGLSF
jgi:hypothetical protein